MLPALFLIPGPLVLPLLQELLSRVAFGPEAAAARVRAHVQAHWSSRSADSFLDQSAIDAAISSAQVVPPSRIR